MGILKPNSHNVETSTADFNQILRNDITANYYSWVVPSRRTTNPRWRMAAILKNRKTVMFPHGLTDRHEIWQSDSDAAQLTVSSDFIVIRSGRFAVAYMSVAYGFLHLRNSNNNDM